MNSRVLLGKNKYYWKKVLEYYRKEHFCIKYRLHTVDNKIWIFLNNKIGGK